jgi:hypothetical protein
VAFALVLTGAVAAAVPVAATVALAVPQHRRLGAGFDASAHARLVACNWVRTLAWSVHAGIAITIVWQSSGR